MPLQFDEKTLIQQAQSGNLDALGALYEQHVAAIYRFIFYRTGDAMAAEDLTAEVFAAMMTAIQRYKERGAPFKAWLFRIARAKVADYWRKVKRHEKYQEVFMQADTSAKSTQNALEDHFQYENLKKALRYLTPAEVEVVILRFGGGLDHQEIATVIRSNANAVKSKLRRALEKLHHVLDQLDEFTEERRQK